MAQKIFGYFDKAQLIDLFNLILEGKENEVIEVYRKIYNQGVEPKIFINDFLELIYYFKNINSLTLEGTNFSLNDVEFNKIQKISKDLNNEVLILFWQFTIKVLDELDIVSNQHLSIEMFLMRLIHLSGYKTKNEDDNKNSSDTISNNNNEQKVSKDLSNKETINQIKNITQEQESKPKTQLETKAINEISINSLNELIEISNSKKEMKLKYELEKNVNLVRFEKNRIEISFNDNLDKNFVKDLSSRLLDWTGQRWIISFSKKQGELTIKEKEKSEKIKLIEKAKKSDLYSTLINYFSDAELVDIKTIEKDEK
jgi:DNA polymerase-3 subunit gamma/tau